MKKIVTAFLIVSLLCSGIPCEAKTKDTIYLEKGQSYSLKLKGKYNYTSKNRKKVQISKTGKIHARKIGSSSITATKGKREISYKVIVVGHLRISAQREDENCYLYPEEHRSTLQLSFPVPNEKIKWKSSDETVATVDKNGLVIGHSAGHCIIYVKYLGKTYKFALSVILPPAD